VLKSLKSGIYEHASENLENDDDSMKKTGPSQISPSISVKQERGQRLIPSLATGENGRHKKTERWFVLVKIKCMVRPLDPPQARVEVTFDWVVGRWPGRLNG
jgi:hypothetical protein